MASEWIELTDDEVNEAVYVNLANARLIRPDNGGRVGNLVSFGRWQRWKGSCQGAPRKGSCAV